ncbi:MAG: TIGR04255 family protein [Raineya sp.]|nr:TIGR04255 family protein [Raineya sp.]MDW8295956.1 TIGR04255 family protein [Raineya sp.]
MLEKLSTIHPQHPIEEVIFAVFLHQTIARLDKFYQLQEKLHFNHLNYREGFINNQKISTGIEISQINQEGKIQKFLSISNENQRGIIRFHELAYTRWAEFKPLVLQILEYCNQIHKGLYVDAISLTYVDTFRWEDMNEPIPLAEIFNPDALPKSLFYSKDIFTFSLHKIARKNKEYNDQTDIDLREIYEPTPYTRLSVIHTVNLRISTEDLGEILTNKLLDEELEFAHQTNKEKMKELFQEKIRLEKMNLKV